MKLIKIIIALFFVIAGISTLANDRQSDEKENAPRIHDSDPTV